MAQFTVVTITRRGLQMAASGFSDRPQMLRHLADRLEESENNIEFIVITTEVGTVSDVKHLNRDGASFWAR